MPGRSDRDGFPAVAGGGRPRVAVVGRPWPRGLLQLVLAVLLACTLTACGGASAPPRATLLNALALQIQLTQ
ncbi:MAG: hypothetical protein VKO44_05875, partial [Cyanobacteriota bacterium]|nr:hypothetical protein [Cyanobacteriota bacterium]